MRLEMLHSYSQELVHGWENQPTSLLTQWQFKRVKGPLLKLYWIIELRQGDLDIPCVNLPDQQPFWFNALRTSPLKDMSGDCGSDYPQSPCQPSRGQERNRRWRDQRPQSPWSPSPSPDHGFKSKKVHYQQCLQCRPDLIAQTGQGIPD